MDNSNPFALLEDDNAGAETFLSPTKTKTPVKEKTSPAVVAETKEGEDQSMSYAEYLASKGLQERQADVQQFAYGQSNLEQSDDDDEWACSKQKKKKKKRQKKKKQILKTGFKIEGRYDSNG